MVAVSRSANHREYLFDHTRNRDRCKGGAFLYEARDHQVDFPEMDAAFLGAFFERKCLSAVAEQEALTAFVELAEELLCQLVWCGC